MNNKITTWEEAHMTLGGGTSSIPMKCPTKAQLISTFNRIDATKLSGYFTMITINYPFGPQQIGQNTTDRQLLSI